MVGEGNERTPLLVGTAANGNRTDVEDASGSTTKSKSGVNEVEEDSTDPTKLSLSTRNYILFALWSCVCSSSFSGEKSSQ